MGWVLCCAAAVTTAAYMFRVGLAKASLVAEVAGLFLALIGLALAWVDRDRGARRRYRRNRQVMKDVIAEGDVIQGAASPGWVDQEMERVRSSGRVVQFFKAVARMRSREGG